MSVKIIKQWIEENETDSYNYATMMDCFNIIKKAVEWLDIVATCPKEMVHLMPLAAQAGLKEIEKVCKG